MDFLPPATFKQRAYIIACALLVVAGHLAFGALTAETSLGLVIAWAGLLIVGALTVDRPRHATLKPLILPAAGFGLVLVFTLLTLVTLPHGAGHPIWEVAGLPGRVSVDPSETQLEFLRLLGLGCVFVVGWGLGLQDATALRAFKAVTYAGGIFVVIALIAHLAGLAPKTQAGRLEAMFLNPNTAGALAGAILCLATGLALRSLRRARNGAGLLALPGPFACCLLAGTALWLTHSRGAIAATAAALAFLLVAQGVTRRWRVKHFLIVCGAFVVIVAAALSAPGMAERLTSLGDDSRLRHYIFDATLRTVGEAPWLGHGLGTFDTVTRSHLSPDSYPLLWNIRAAENVYAQWLLEAGWLGAAAMFSTVGALIVVALRQTGRRRSMLGPLHALIAVDLVFILHGVTDFALQNYSMSIFWALLLGLQFSWSGNNSRERRGQ